MSIISSILIVCFIGSLGAWQPDIDINRVQLIKAGSSNRLPPINSHKRRSILNNRHYNAYDDYSIRLTKLQPSLQLLSNAASSSEKKTVKVHQPREDPKLFYQSDAYLKQVIGKNINHEVSEIYPGVEVVRADQHNYHNHRPYPSRLTARDVNNVRSGNICVKCPHDRTLITKAGTDRVVLQYPHLRSCSGFKAPREVKFVTMYGPRFGSLLGEGSHGIVGHLTYRNEILQYCYMDVRVLTQTCPLPKYLMADCRAQNKTCTFVCRDAKAVLHGQKTLRCGDDMKWFGHLPLCKVQSWCEALPPPKYGRVTCKSSAVKSWGLAEGSTCRVRCTAGRKPSPRTLAVCRKGAWTHNITCEPNE